MKLIVQSVSVLAACLLLLLILATPLTSYMAYILGLLIVFSVIYVVIRQRTRKNAGDVIKGTSLEIGVLIFALLLAVFLTGGLGSNLYFLLYFIIFGIVFVFEPAVVFALLLGLMIVFYPSLSQGDLPSNLIKLGSLVFLSPISFFFGREFVRREKLENEIQDKTSKIIKDAEHLKKSVKDEKATKEIEDIVERANDLRNT